VIVLGLIARYVGSAMFKLSLAYIKEELLHCTRHQFRRAGAARA